MVREQHHCIGWFDNLHNVAFHYATRADVPVLKNVSFSARPGERIALVGPSGAGKSTIASLILRFYRPVEGSIHIDGKDIASYDLTAFRDRLSIVPQEVLLFGGTIKENISYGRPGATDSEIEAAAEKANAHEFIERFLKGTPIVGERGVQLSGGQRQRLPLRGPCSKTGDPILDEATSHSIQQVKSRTRCLR